MFSEIFCLFPPPIFLTFFFLVAGLGLASLKELSLTSCGLESLEGLASLTLPALDLTGMYACVRACGWVWICACMRACVLGRGRGRGVER
jgi:hypothetical protein